MGGAQDDAMAITLARPASIARDLAAPSLAAAPGIGLCLLVTALAFAAQGLETQLFGRAWLEALVLAILIGAMVRTVWTPGAFWRRGIEVSAKLILEIAVVLLGCSISAASLIAAGPALLLGIAGVVALAIGASYGLGRLFGLSHRLSTLVACGNSICGNSAIAAVAPVIGADGEEVAASISFTAVLGVVVVLGLPLAGALIGLSPLAYGVFAGLTVYAVPQVLAATVGYSAISAQMGTLVKLVRVLMLGPVVLSLSLLGARRSGGASLAKVGLSRLVPWFILGFLLMIGLRSAGLIPTAALPTLSSTATALTIVSMAALGLGVNIRAVARAGLKVTAVVSLSLAVLALISLTLMKVLGFF
jgi:uncharacterized integral membrane protein (TIGR00698 family)